MPVISNNTPLSALGSIGQLPLLNALFGDIFIPPAVKDEFIAIDSVARAETLKQMQWLKVKPITNLAIKASFAHLDEGEAEVLTLAIEHPPRLVILDERLARSYAKRLKLPLTGSVGILLRAKQKGLIPSVTQLITQMVDEGFYLHPNVIQQARQLAGE